MKNESTSQAAGVAKPLCFSSEKKGKNLWDSGEKWIPRKLSFTTS